MKHNFSVLREVLQDARDTETPEANERATISGRVTPMQAFVALEAVEARIAELEALLDSVTPEKDAEGIILNAKQKLGGNPTDSLIHLCIKTVYERDHAKREERERIIALLLATNPMDVSICDSIHGDQWIDDVVRHLFEPKN